MTLRLPDLRRATATATAVAVAAVTLALTAPGAAADDATPRADDRPSAVPPPELVRPAGVAADPSVTTMAFNGRGWGHGRGMSQWGSQGYATEHGWSTQEILAHYYGGTTAGTAAQAADLPIDPSKVRIRLVAQDAHPTTVQVASGTLRLSDAGALQDPGDLTAVRLSAQPDGTLLVERADTCAGPFQALGADGRSGRTAITVSVTSGNEQLQVCRDDGVITWYPGTITSTVVEGVQRTVNTTSIEAQLRSVVPRESPASWDADALGAQAVAARSYALAGDTRHFPYADTCDTTLCQVYAGHFRKVPGGVKEATTDPRTDAAIAATAGQVRLDGAGRIARTEFSSTSGGWTAGGTFPAVEDLGDVISPLHTWTRTAELTRLEDQYAEGERLVDIEVLDRNGLGADGGRVLEARLTFTDGSSVDLSGNTIRSRAGLLSDWFTPTCPVASAYLDAVFQLFLNRSVTGGEIEEWCPRVRQGERFALTSALSVSDEWAGVQIEGLYGKILRRASEEGGRQYWLGRVVDGLLIEEIAAQFYGSEEYFLRAGSTHQGFVDAIYRDLLGREAEGDGRAFWIKVLDQDVMNRVEVAREFYASIESRSDRVQGLYHQILDRAPDAEGLAYWADLLPQLGDVALAAFLAASDEFYVRSTSDA